MSEEILDVTVLPPEAAAVLKTNDIGESGIAAITKSFAVLFEDANKWEAEARSIVVTSIADVSGMKKARELRLRLKDIRTTAEKKRKELKEDSLRTGKAIDGIANVLKALIEPIESRLEEQEKFIEREQARINEEKRRTRRDAVIPFAEVAGYIEQMDLAVLTDSDFSALLESLASQLSARRKAEENAQAERVAQEKARIESEEKRIAEEKRVLAELEMEKAQREIAEKARLDAEKKMEAERMEQKKIAEKERAKAEKLRLDEEKKRKDAEGRLAEIKRKEEEEKKRIAAEAKAASKAPDKEKLLVFSGEIEKLLSLMPKCKTPEGEKAGELIAEKTKAFSGWVKRIASEI